MIDTDRFMRAFNLALELHGDQTRKGSDISYMGHLLGALLHDGPEDSGGEETLTRIRDEFGEEVAEIVDHLSDTFEDPKPPWKARKEQYLSELEALPADDLGHKVLRVSLADIYEGKLGSTALVEEFRDAVKLMDAEPAE